MSAELRYFTKIVKVRDPLQTIAYGGKTRYIDKKIRILQQRINGKWVDVPEIKDND